MFTPLQCLCLFTCWCLPWVFCVCQHSVLWLIHFQPFSVFNTLCNFASIYCGLTDRVIKFMQPPENLAWFGDCLIVFRIGAGINGVMCQTRVMMSKSCRTWRLDKSTNWLKQASRRIKCHIFFGLRKFKTQSTAFECFIAPKIKHSLLDFKILTVYESQFPFRLRAFCGCLWRDTLM